GGSGREISDPCNVCDGSGQVRETRTLQVKVPAGVDDGDRIRLSGEGGAGLQGGMAGDLYVDIQVRPHKIFKREGDHLHAEIPIPITTAMLGGQIKVPTLDGSVMVKIPEGTQTGKTFRLKNKGVQSVRSHRPGDLMVQVAVETPVNLTRRQKELLRELQESLEGEQASDHSPKSRSWTDSVKDFFERMGL
ncbi:MAG: DnaJ C-terminal domain-containing protein, partial [Wenzhouxiangellaceae bacterium]